LRAFDELRLVALRDLGDSNRDGARNEWRLFTYEGAAVALADAPKAIADVGVDVAPGGIALWVRGEDGVYRWYARRATSDGAALESLGTTASPQWLGLGSRADGDQLAFTGAEHTVDGRAATAVPKPAFWVHKLPFA